MSAPTYDEAASALAVAVTRGNTINVSDMQRALAHFVTLHASTPAVPDSSSTGSAEQRLLQRAIDLHEKAGMSWPQAEELALEESGVDTKAVDEIIGSAMPSVIVTLLDEEEVREFVRSVLVYAPAALYASTPPAASGSAEPVAYRFPKAGIGNGFHYVDNLEGEEDRFKSKWQALYPGAPPSQQADAERYRSLRRGQKWSVIDGIGNTLRGEKLDTAIDAASGITPAASKSGTI